MLCRDEGAAIINPFFRVENYFDVAGSGGCLISISLSWVPVPAGSGRHAWRRQRVRAWAFARSAAVSDALSTACMVLSEPEIAGMMAGREEWAVLLKEGNEWRQYGRLPLERLS